MFTKLASVDLKLLEVFITIVECGGFSAAQAELNMSQSTISTHVSDLETRLGCKLCDRGRAGFRLTEQGKQVLAAARELMSATRSFTRTVNLINEGALQRIRFGCADGLATDKKARIADLISGIKRHAPAIQIELIVADPVQLERAVIDDRADCAIEYFGYPIASLQYRKLFDEEMSVYCGSDHPFFARENIAVLDLQAMPWAVRSYLVPEAKDAPSIVKITAQANTEEGLLHFALAGTHLVYLPTLLAESWVRTGKLQQLCKGTADYVVPHGLISRRGQESDRVKTSFLNIIKRQFA